MVYKTIQQQIDERKVNRAEAGVAIGVKKRPPGRPPKDPKDQRKTFLLRKREKIAIGQLENEVNLRAWNMLTFGIPELVSDADRKIHPKCRKRRTVKMVNEMVRINGTLIASKELPANRPFVWGEKYPRLDGYEPITILI